MHGAYQSCPRVTLLGSDPTRGSIRPVDNSGAYIAYLNLAIRFSIIVVVSGGRWVGDRRSAGRSVGGSVGRPVGSVGQWMGGWCICFLLA